jgi:ABC-type nitrate/sulfonate/bicarbonate transport system permease component
MITATEEISPSQLGKTAGPDNGGGTSRNGKGSSKRFIQIASLVVVLVLWELLGRQVNPLFASYPSAIAGRGVEMVKDGTIATALLDSLRPMFSGYLLAAIVAIPLGMLIGRFRKFDAAVGLYVMAGYAMPMVALIPLFILWFGLGFSVKVAVVFVMTIFPIIINTTAGVRAVPQTLVEVGKSFMASEFDVLRKIVLPSAIPHIMTGLQLGVGRAVIGIVVAEFFTSLGGLGGLIVDAGTRFDTASLFVPVIILMGLGIGLTSLIAALERKIAPWHQSESQKQAN